jgi:hypothetical protein
MTLADCKNHPALKRPLRFGDPEQVEVLKEWRRILDEEDAEAMDEETRVAEGFKEFWVRVSFHVYAKTQEAAEERAAAKMEAGDFEMTVSEND